MPALFVTDVPTHGARVKDEGEEYYLRNRDGSMKKFLDHTQNRNFTSPRPMPRTGGNSEAMEQLEKHRGSMNLFMDEKRNMKYASPRRPPRCPGAEAQEQYARAQGSMSSIMAGHGGKDPRNRNQHAGRGVPAEAKSNAYASKGLGTKKLFETYGRVTPRPPSQARVKPEAEEIANASKGMATKTLFHSYGKMAVPMPKQCKAVPDESRAMHTMGQGGRAKKLLSMDPPSGR